MTKVRIALTGGLRAGKDEVAKRLQFEHKFQRYAFGDMLKHFAFQVFPTVRPSSKPRAFLQAFGQSMRNMPVDGAADVWVTWLEHAMLTDGFDRVVITDLRQPNELKWARANGFVIVRVTAPADVRLARAQAAGDDFKPADMAHDTEQHVGGFTVDYELTNDGTVAELYAKVDALVGCVMEGEI